MTFSRTLVSAALAVAATPAFAGDFVTLPTTDPLRVVGSNNQAVDPLYLPSTPTADPLVFDLPPYLQLLQLRETEFDLPEVINPLDPLTDPGEPDAVFLPATGEGDFPNGAWVEFEEKGIFYDAVFRNTNTGQLVFGSRIIMGEDDPLSENPLDRLGDGEVNDIYRTGFTGYTASVAWSDVSAFDLRLVSAARTDDSGLEDVSEIDFDPDIVNLQSDLNIGEGSPFSGWFFVMTNATAYGLREGAVGIGQAGQEFPDIPFTTFITGYTPVPVPAAAWLFLSALGATGFIRRRG